MSDQINPIEAVVTRELAGSIHSLGGLSLGCLEAVEDTDWRKSSLSSMTDCVAFAKLIDGTVALCNSNQPEQGAILLRPEELSAWIAGIKAGEFDDFM